MFLRILAALLVLITVAAPQAATRLKTVNSPDPFFIDESVYQDILTPIRQLPGRTLAASQTLDPAFRNLVLIMYGQSNTVNNVSTFWTAANPTKLFNINIYDGGIYNAPAEPMLGCSGLATQGGPTYILADALITANRFDRVYMMPIGISGGSVTNFSTGIYSTRLPVALRRIAQRGIVVGSNITIALTWGQGESDHGTPTVTYTAELNRILAVAAAYNVRAFIARQTFFAGTDDAAVQAAQWSNSPTGVINNAAGVYKGANTDMLVGNICGPGANLNCRVGGGNDHLSFAGYYSYSADATYGWIQAMIASGAPF